VIFGVVAGPSGVWGGCGSDDGRRAKQHDDLGLNLLSSRTELPELSMPKRNSSAKPVPAMSVTEKNARPSPSILPGPIPKGREEPESSVNSLPEVETDFAELENGSLVEIVEDPADPNRTLFAISKRGRTRLSPRIEDRGRILVPIPRSTVGFSDVKLPRGVVPYKSVKRLAQAVARLIRCVVDVPDEYVMLLSSYVLYTWVADRLPIAVYLSVVGIPQSGKSTLLEILSLLCRRALLVNDISQAAAYQVCSNFSPTLLIDEIDWRSSSSMGAFRQMLRAGISPSSRALRVRQSSCSFGPKVFGSLDASSDAALNSRCIQIIMAETNKRGLYKPGHPSVVEFASHVRQQLLRFRFAYYKSIRPAVLKGAEDLRPRSRDILSSLAAPLVRCQFWTHYLLCFMKEIHDPVTRESLEPRHEALLAVLWEVIHRQPPISNVRIGGQLSLSTSTNGFLQLGGERLSVTDKGVGRMLSSMGFRSTQRTKNGWILWLDSSTVARCHQMLQTHGNRYVPDWDYAQHSTKCSECKACAAPNVKKMHSARRR
jgi:hypothetical protein